MKGFIVQKNQIFFTLVFLFHFQAVFSIGDLFVNDVRSFSLGNVRALSNELLNPAAVSFSGRRQAGVSVFNRFQMNELNTGSLYLKYPDSRLDMGAKAVTFGYEDYRLTQIQGDFAKKLSEGLAIGVQLNYLHESSILEDGTADYFSSSLGLYYRMNEKLDFVLLSENLLHTFNENRLDIHAGMLYRASSTTCILLEARYGPANRFRFSAGVEYVIFEQFILRSGFDSDANTPTFGVAYQWAKWRVEAGFAIHSVLGMSSMIGVSYEL